jgi:hypothetical protein
MSQPLALTILTINKKKYVYVYVEAGRSFWLQQI